MTMGDAIRLAEEGRAPDGVTRTLVRCLIYVSPGIPGEDVGAAGRRSTLSNANSSPSAWQQQLGLPDVDVTIHGTG
jgi:hypothetical protein